MLLNEYSSCSLFFSMRLLQVVFEAAGSFLNFCLLIVVFLTVSLGQTYPIRFLTITWFIVLDYNMVYSQGLPNDKKVV